jgi:CRP-like cAMP-binding protein
MQHFKKGEIITKFGDIGDKYYILASGVVKVKVYEPGTSPFDPNLEKKTEY